MLAASSWLLSDVVSHLRARAGRPAGCHQGPPGVLLEKPDTFPESGARGSPAPPLTCDPGQPTGPHVRLRLRRSPSLPYQPSAGSPRGGRQSAGRVAPVAASTPGSAHGVAGPTPGHAHRGGRPGQSAPVRAMIARLPAVVGTP